jgi:hypothetical protein
MEPLSYTSPGFPVRRKLWGNCLYAMVKKFTVLPFEPSCCTYRKVLNGVELVDIPASIQTAIERIRSKELHKLAEYRLVAHRIDDRLIELFLRRALRISGLDTGKLPRYHSRIKSFHPPTGA